MAIRVDDERAEAIARVAPPPDRWNLIWQSKLGRALVLSVALAIVAASCGGGSGGGNAVSDEGSSETDTASKDVAFDFSSTLYQGESKLGAAILNLSDLQGKPTVLNFWAGLCPACVAEMPDLQRFYDDFGDRATLIGVDVGQFTGLGNQCDARDLLDQLGVTYPAGYTDDSNVVRQYRVLSMPTTVFITSDGEVFKTWIGVLNQDVLTKVTTEMLNQEAALSQVDPIIRTAVRLK